MPLVLKACIREECDGLSFSDTTREYDATDNPGGYGSPNTITGPSDFDTLTLTWWQPMLDPSVDPPTTVIDLLENVPTQSSDEDYDWPTFTFEELGITSIDAGVGYFEYVGTKDGDEYRADFTAILVKSLYDVLKVKVAQWRPGNAEGKECIPPIKLWNALHLVMCGGTCDKQDATDIIKWIKANLNNCC